MKKGAQAILFLLVIISILPDALCRGASIDTQAPLRGRDHIIYHGKVHRLDPAVIEVEIAGPACAGRRQFKRSNWLGQGAHSVGSKIDFILSGVCTNVDTVLTVEPGGK